MSEPFPHVSWWTRMRWWFLIHFQRQHCDGCDGNFPVRWVTPVSGDMWLCEKCLDRWYPD